MIFAVINATFLRPLPYPQPHRLVILRWQDQGDLSAAAFFMVKNEAHFFSSVTALYPAEVGVNISAIGPPQYVKALSVSKDFFQTLGVQPEVGNTFNAEQDLPNAPLTAVLSYGLWEQGFNRDSSALGHDLWVNNRSYKIIGIMPRGFRSYPDADIWLPLQLDLRNADPGGNYRVIARLAPGISREQVQYELEGVAREDQATDVRSTQKRILIAHDLQAFLVDREREGLAILFAAVAFLFLIACTNVAVLILVRAAANTQTIAIRAALGPPRGRLVVALLTESLVLSVIGGLLGLILAKESLPLLVRLWPAELPLSANLSMDGNVVLFTCAVVVLSPLLFGLAPALKLSRVNLAQILASTSRIASASAEQVRTVRALVFGQMALTVMLLAGTGLLVESLLNLYSTDLGIAPEHLLVAQVSLGGDRYRTAATTDHFLKEVANQLEALPEVEAVAVVDGLPLENGLNLPLGPVETPHAVDHAAEYRPITPDYFKTLHVPLRSGRFFAPADMAGTAPVAIINATLAHRWWPNTSAIGHFIKVDEELGPQTADSAREIVGVVSDIREKGLGVPPAPTMFIPISQTPDAISAFFNKVFLTSIVIRTSHGTDFSNQVRSAIQSVDPDLPLASFRPFSRVVDRSLANQRFVVLLAAAFAAFALLLTAVGVHGLLNYQARLRTREIAVRMAVGASRSHIIRMIAQQGGKLMCLAVVAGLAGAFVIRGLLGSLLYNVHSSSLIVIVATGLLLGLVATLVSLLTAFRAASIEPMAVLRNE